MQCPKCHTRMSQVVLETRTTEDGTYRRRTCGMCAKVYVTVEKPTGDFRLPANANRRVRVRPEHQPENHGRPSFDALAAFNRRSTDESPD